MDFYALKSINAGHTICGQNCARTKKLINWVNGKKIKKNLFCINVSLLNTK